MEELRIATDLFAKYRLPKVGDKIIAKLEKIKVSKFLDMSISEAYYSESIQGYNVDFVITLSYEDYVDIFEEVKSFYSNKYYNKRNFIKDVKQLSEKAFTLFMSELNN